MRQHINLHKWIEALTQKAADISPAVEPMPTALAAAFFDVLEAVDELTGGDNRTAIRAAVLVVGEMQEQLDRGETPREVDYASWCTVAREIEGRDGPLNKTELAARRRVQRLVARVKAIPMTAEEKAELEKYPETDADAARPHPLRRIKEIL